MVDITLEKKDEINGVLTVKLVESDYKESVDKKVKDYSKKANLKGFRPGKVPTSVIMRMMGKSIIAEEVQQLLAQSINNYIKENNLPIIGDPLPTEENEKKEIDWENDKEFDFSYDLGLAPEFTVEVSNKLKLNKYQVEVDDKTLTETSENLQRQYGTFDNNEAVSEDDFVSGELVAEDGSFNKKTMIPLSKVNPKVIKNFLGAKPGEEIKFDLKKAFKKDAASISHATGMSIDEAKEVKGDYILKVDEIHSSNKAELNQEFFDKVFGPGAIKTEAEYNERLKAIVQSNYAQDSDVKLVRDIKDKMIEKTKIDVPVEFFKRWLLVTNKEELTEEALEKDFENYEKELKWTLIRNKITESNAIKAENEEVIEKAKQIIQAQYLQGMAITPEMEPKVMEFVHKYLQDDNGKNFYKVYEDVLNDKVFNYIRSTVSIKEKKVKVEEFKKLLTKE